MKYAIWKPVGACLFFIHVVTVRSAWDGFALCGTPQLCKKETRLPTVFAEVGDNFTFNICVVSDGYLFLKTVGLGLERKTFLHKERFNVYTDTRRILHCYQHDIKITVNKVEVAEFGPMIFEWLNAGNSGLIGFNHTIRLVTKGIVFNIYKSLHQVQISTSNVFSKNDSLYLMCESSDYPPSSLSIVKQYSMEILHTTVLDGALVYHVESVQCSHMGTYVCLYANDSSQNSTLEVVLRCPPKLCPRETKTRTIFTAVNENVNIDICVISWEFPSLDTVFQNGNNMNKLPASRYRDSSISAKATHKHTMHYWNVNLVLHDIKEKDFGKTSVFLSFPFSKPLIYGMVLAKKDFDFRAEGSSQSPFIVSESLMLKCKTEGLSSSSLSIVKRGNNQPLHTEVMNGSLVYTIESLQCQDMGTYLCLYSKDTSQNVTLDIHVVTCMTFMVAGPSGLNYSVSNNISLVCESSDFEPSDLSISVKDGNGSQELKTEIVKNTLVHSLDDLRCSDMATYICQHANDTSYNATFDLPICNCAPQLCPKENQTRTVTVELNSDLDISFCVISNYDFFLERVFLGGSEDNLLEKQRYKPYNSSEITGKDLYHSVDIVMYNITEEDFGRVTFRLAHISVVDLRLDYEIKLEQTTDTRESLHETNQNITNGFTSNLTTIPLDNFSEFTANYFTTTPLGNFSEHSGLKTTNSDPSMIYMISGVCAFVALVLVGIFIYCQIRVKNYKNNGNHIAQTNPDVHCVLLNYLPKHGVNDSTGGVKQSHDNLVCTTSFSNISANNDDNIDDDDEDDRETEEELDDELQLPGYHIYDVID